MSILVSKKPGIFQIILRLFLICVSICAAIYIAAVYVEGRDQLKFTQYAEATVTACGSKEVEITSRTNDNKTTYKGEVVQHLTATLDYNGIIYTRKLSVEIMKKSYSSSPSREKVLKDSESCDYEIGMPIEVCFLEGEQDQFIEKKSYMNNIVSTPTFVILNLLNLFLVVCHVLTIKNGVIRFLSSKKGTD